MKIVSPFLFDFLMVGGFFVLGIASMLTAYRVGNPTWKDRFNVKKTGPDGADGKVRGEYGEAIMMVLSVVILTIVNRLTPDVTLVNTISGSLFVAVAVAIVFLTAATLHGIKASRDVQRNEPERSKEYVQALRRGYRFYGVYSAINYSFGLLIVLLIWEQFQIDLDRFARQQGEVRNLLMFIVDHDGKSPTDLISMIEKVYGEVIAGAALAIMQVNTILLVLLAAFGTSFILNLSRLRGIYEASAVRVFNLAALGATILVFVIGWFIYFNGYVPFIENSLTGIETAKSAISGGTRADIQRYYEILIDLNARRGEVGFLLTLTSERGGFLLLLIAIQFFLSVRRGLLNAGVKSKRPDTD